MTILVFPVWFTGCVGFCETLTEAQSSTSALPRSEERVCWQMSGAHHGYMDPASTDEGATDETDEVNLQVLCLTGEGVTLRSLSLPRSMFGYDLRRLVSEKLPCKPGAKPAMHHVNANLTESNLGRARDCWKIGNAVMHIYISTNLYTAWNYVCGLPTCERDFVVEGVTQLKGAVPGEYLHHLPCSLASLSFGEEFNQSLERVTLPSTLHSLSFGRSFSTKAWSEWPSHRVFKAWVLAGVSTEAWSLWPCHRLFKAWALAKSSTKAWSVWPSHQVFKGWVLVVGSTKAWTGWPCHRAFKAWV